jgi:hypothetical protein
LYLYFSLFGKMFSRIGLIVIVLGVGTLNAADELPPIRLSPGSVVCDGSTVPSTAVRNVGIQTENWTWQMFPDGFIYPTYLAAVQNRLDCVWNYDKDLDWIWDITLGGRAPLFRYGNRSALYPEGWQLDLDGSVHLRLHLRESMDMEANDFRFGFPLSYGTKIWQFRTGYYHVSSHMGDERMIRHYPNGDPTLPDKTSGMGTRQDSSYRVNFYREAWLLSYAFRPTPNTRLYAEADYAFMQGVLTKPWHFQFGAEYSPLFPTARGEWGTPFAAINVRLMEEHDFDGNLTLQTGWQWRGARNQLFRVGVQYFTGVSDQYEFIATKREHKVGIGVWYDF